MLWIFAERFFMAALRQCEKSEGCFAVFTAQPWTAAVLFKLQFSDGLLAVYSPANSTRFRPSSWLNHGCSAGKDGQRRARTGGLKVCKQLNTLDWRGCITAKI